MPIEVGSEHAVCCKCGTAYGRRKGYFPVSYAQQYKGTGYIPVCKKCIDEMYNAYLAQCNDPKRAVRQVCRKLDLYWSPSVFEIVSRKSSISSMMTQYIAKINTVTYAGKSYDDTLSENGTLWDDGDIVAGAPAMSDEGASGGNNDLRGQDGNDLSDVPDSVIEFWGSGYNKDTYDELEQKKRYYFSKLPEEMQNDIGAEVLIKQICNMEINIARDNAAGKPIDKSVNALNTLIGSLKLKPAQKKDDVSAADESTPFGVWIKRFEDNKPIPDVDPDFADVDKIKYYITVWFFGHLCKMLGIKNSYSDAYDKEIEKTSVQKPVYEEDESSQYADDLFGQELQDEQV